MVDKPAEERSQGRQGRATNTGNVSPLSGAINKQRQLPTPQQNNQNRIPNNLLLDLFERVNQILRSCDEPEQLAAQFLEICLEAFGCDQVWLLAAEQSCWSIKQFNCRPQTPLAADQTRPFQQTLSEFLQRTAHNNRPLTLTAASHGPIPVEISQHFDCHSLLLLPVTLANPEPELLVLNQCHQVRIWHHDEVRLLQELTHRWADGLKRLSETQSWIRAETRLRELQQHRLHSIPLPLIGIDTEKRICQWNPAAEKLFGIKPEAAIDSPWQTLFSDLNLTDEQIALALATQATVPLGQIAWQHAEQTKLCDFNLYPCTEPLLANVLIRVEDATQRLQMEELLMQQEKMTSVGNLAAGVAHEINNPLAGTLQNLQVLRNRLHPNLPKNIETAAACGIDIDHLDDYAKQRGIHALLNSAIESGQQATKIVHNMLNFNSKADDSFDYHQLDALLDKALELAAGNHKLSSSFDFRQLEIVRHYAAELPELYCSAGQLQQVFLNLLNNAAHALKKRLRFWEKNSSTLPTAEKPRLTLRLNRQQDHLRCVIEDNGCGMDEDVRKRVFEPFYTTKQAGAGTGLGMSICYFVITKNHNGRMGVDSTPNLGSRFTLEFPLANRSI